MVIVPLCVGIYFAGWSWIHIPLAVAWLSGYFCFFALGLWLKVRTARRGNRKKQYAVPLTVYGVVSAMASLIVIVATPDVIIFAVGFAPLVAVAVWEAWCKRSRSLASGVSTTLASGLLIPVASFLTGRLNLTVWIAAIVIGLYFVGTVPLVKTFIRNRGSSRMLIASVSYHALTALVVVVIAVATRGWWLAVAVYALLLVRSWAAPVWNNRRVAAGHRTMSAKNVGVMESVFTILVVAASIIH